MANLQIGLSGLSVAQQAIELVGTNIANAGTDGYHKQTLKIVPLYLGARSNVTLGGAEVSEVRRTIDQLLELEILKQYPEIGQISQELASLEMLEASLGNLEGGGLATGLNDFFSALRELSDTPNSEGLRDIAVLAADGLATQFRHLAEFLDDLNNHIYIEAKNLIEQVNSLTTEIAQMNREIQALATRGGNINLFADQRDQAIAELAELADVTTQRFGSGEITNVWAWGIPLVSGTNAVELEVSLLADQKLGISPKGDNTFRTDLRGGELGGILALKNDLLSDVQDRLDLLTKEIVYGINDYHVEGVGTEGSFTSLTGWAVSDELLSEWDNWGTYMVAGDFYIRVTDSQTGGITRYSVDVDPATDDLASIVTKINNLTAPLTASAPGSALHIEVTDLNRYTFDFLPTPMAQYDAGWTAGNTAEVTISGIYTGESNQDFTVTVLNGGDVGITANLGLEVKDGSGELVETFSLGTDYIPGVKLDLGNGITISLSAGTLVTGDDFTIQALSDSDTSGFLPAAGMNAFLSGDSARTVRVTDRVLQTPGYLACAIGAEINDNVNAVRMAALGEQTLTRLGSVTPGDYYRLLVTNVGQNISLRKARLNSAETLMQQLTTQRSRFSGVDINEQAAQMLVFEQMFQAMAKYISTQQKMMQTVIDMI